MKLFASNRRGSNGRDGEQDTEADDDEQRDDGPDGGNVVKQTGLPQREAGADHEDEVADQIEMNESHAVTWDSGFGIRRDSG